MFDLREARFKVGGATLNRDAASDKDMMVVMSVSKVSTFPTQGSEDGKQRSIFAQQFALSQVKKFGMEIKRPLRQAEMTRQEEERLRVASTGRHICLFFLHSWMTSEWSNLIWVCIITFHIVMHR